MSRIFPTKTVLARETKEGAIIVNSETGEAFKLNPTAVAIWRGIEAGKALEQVANELAENFAIDRKVAMDDVQETAQALNRWKLIVLDTP